MLRDRGRSESPSGSTNSRPEDTVHSAGASIRAAWDNTAMSADLQGEGSIEIEALRQGVAELQRRESALAVELKLVTQVLDTLSDLVAMKDQDLRFRYANKAFCKFYGRTLEQVVGAIEADLEPAEAARAHAAQDREVLSAGIIVNIPSEILLQSDGRKAHFATIRCAVRDADGRVAGVLSSARPIQVNTSVTSTGAIESAGHNQLLLTIIPDMYFRIARDSTYVDFSAAKGSDTALPPALFIGKKMIDVTPDLAGPVMSCAETVLRTGEMQTLEFKMFMQGEYRDYEARIMMSGPDEVLAIVREITAQKRVEEEQQRLQEELLRMKDQMMEELSTPLIPISDRVVVMPLIGAMDEHRASHMVERLLTGIAERSAAVAILDITGLSSLSTQTAGALVRCAQAARLLGARVILTGIRADVARTLVTMGLDLSGIVTLGTLQSGIEHALRI